MYPRPSLSTSPAAKSLRLCRRGQSAIAALFVSALALFIPAHPSLAEGRDDTPDTAKPELIPPGIAPAEAAQWRLVWHDEFDGDTLDETKWNYRSLGPRESAVISKDCISLDGHGLLHVWVKDKDGVLQNGMIGTQRKFEATFGIMA